MVTIFELFALLECKVICASFTSSAVRLVEVGLVGTFPMAAGCFERLELGAMPFPILSSAILPLESTNIIIAVPVTGPGAIVNCMVPGPARTVAFVGSPLVAENGPFASGAASV